MSYSSAMFQALSILLYIHFKTEDECYEYLSARSISEMLKIPAPTVAKILSKLNAASLIFTKEGAGGGNMLARPVGRISLLDVFLAIEQSKPLFKIQYDFSNLEFDQLESIKEKGINSLKEAEAALKRTLEGRTLADLIQ